MTLSVPLELFSHFSFLGSKVSRSTTSTLVQQEIEKEQRWDPYLKSEKFDFLAVSFKGKFSIGHVVASSSLKRHFQVRTPPFQS